MIKEKVKSKNVFSLNRAAIAACVLFLFLGIFFVGSAGNLSTNSSFSFGPSTAFAQAAPAATPAPAPAKAETGGGLSGQLANLLANLVGLFVQAVGFFLGLIMDGVIIVAQYNDFTTSSAVLNGWVIVRDLCNMFFILILLVIAFATILRVEGYDIKKMVPKLIIMAILINFSKTICALIIDFAQIVMNAFISPIAQIGPLNITTMLGLNGLLKLVEGHGSAATNWGVFLAYIFAFAYSLIAAVVLVVIFAILIVRVVMIWIYVVLSPLAYLLATFPQGKSYVSQWWDDFIKNVTVGPILAFFIWLSLVSLGNTAKGSDMLGTPSDTSESLTGLAGSMTIDQLLKFAISIGMLVGGLIVTQKMGGYMGNFAGKGMAKIQGGVKALGKGTVGAADWLNRQQAKTKFGFDLNMSRQMGNIKESFARGKQRDIDRIETVKDERMAKKGMTALVGGFGAKGWGDVLNEGFMGRGGLRRIFGKGKLDELTAEKKENENKAKSAFSKREYLETSTGYTKEEKDLAEERRQAQQEANSMPVATPEDRLAKKQLLDERFNEIAKKETALAEKRNVLLARRKKAEDNGVYVDTKEQAAEARNKFTGQATSISQEAAKYRFVDLEGRRAQLARIAEAKKKYGDADNEDVLISELEVAMSKKDISLAEGIVARLGEIGGTNALLAKYGYQAQSGLNGNEKNALISRISAGGPDGQKANEEYNRKRGWNDYMREEFGKKMGMNEQSLFNFQNYMAGIGEHAGKEHLMKAINVDANTGEFYQVSEKNRDHSKLVESRKMSNEKKARDYNRLWLGAEDIKTGNFKFSSFGLAEAISQLPIYLKEAENKRLNASLAIAITEPEARKELEDKFRELGIKEISDAKGKPREIGEALDSIAEWAKTSNASIMNKLVPSGGED